MLKLECKDGNGCAKRSSEGCAHCATVLLQQSGCRSDGSKARKGRHKPVRGVSLSKGELGCLAALPPRPEEPETVATE